MTAPNARRALFAIERVNILSGKFHVPVRIYIINRHILVFKHWVLLSIGMELRNYFHFIQVINYQVSVIRY